jgi:D-alanyl-D-alanine dipeptidase
MAVNTKYIKTLLMCVLAYIFCSAIDLSSPAVKFHTNYNFNTQVIDSADAEWAEVDFEAAGIINKMAYADTANFMHTKIYPCARCFLRPEVAEALSRANERARDKGLKLVIYDCYRPYSYQRKMYEVVNNPRYVAPPGKGSNHNRGAAIDITLANDKGEPLDMGNKFDDFSNLSKYDNDSILPAAQKNRRLLRKIMVKAGFTPYNNEWWHFDYRKKRFDTADFKWECDK